MLSKPGDPTASRPWRGIGVLAVVSYVGTFAGLSAIAINRCNPAIDAYSLAPFGVTMLGLNGFATLLAGTALFLLGLVARGLASNVLPERFRSLATRSIPYGAIALICAVVAQILIAPAPPGGCRFDL
jgi:hypothetical protein